MKEKRRAVGNDLVGCEPKMIYLSKHEKNPVTSVLASLFVMLPAPALVMCDGHFHDGLPSTPMMATQRLDRYVLKNFQGRVLFVLDWALKVCYCHCHDDEDAGSPMRPQEKQTREKHVPQASLSCKLYL